MSWSKRMFERAFAGLLCGALILWSVLPSFSHAPSVFETIHDHLELVEGHGHSHGFEEDLYWALHGHSHDVADHDHSQAFLMPSQETRPSLAYGEPWFRMAPTDGPSRHFRIDRPPRA